VAVFARVAFFFGGVVFFAGVLVAVEFSDALFVVAVLDPD
jgi:hypothetical protein